jgi:hypothetical protein
VLTLNDNVKGMFNDRRMAVREEQKAAESAVGFSCAWLFGWGSLANEVGCTDPTVELQDQRHAE